MWRERNVFYLVIDENFAKVGELLSLKKSRISLRREGRKSYSRQTT